MTHEELKQAAIDCLGRAFVAQAADQHPPPYVIAAAVDILLYVNVR